MEVSTIGIIQHVNLIRLRGFCSEGTNRMLVYDYLPNGSLDKWLFSKNESAPVLDWKTRFGIALGMARGILYLHEKCRDCIIHCDIKPENILLDGEFCPKVADFGLSKLMGREFSHVLTTMRGTRGYLAPEWISGLPITPKADVYSFGMTLLEIIAGRSHNLCKHPPCLCQNWSFGTRYWHPSRDKEIGILSDDAAATALVDIYANCASIDRMPPRNL